MPKPAALERHYTQDELADALGVHVVTIKRACKAGELSFYRLGRAVRIPQSAVDDWLARKRVPANA
jgi:excisionase family DNA binding protein